MSECNRIRLLDPTYVKLKKSDNGKRVLKILKILIKGKKTRADIKDETVFSTSEVRRLLLRAQKLDLVEEYKKIVDRRPGKPVIGNFEKETGRPAVYYGLTRSGLNAIRFDPEIIDHWNEIKKIYGFSNETSFFDSYEDLLNALEDNSILREFDKPSFDVEFLQHEVFDRFVYVSKSKEKDVTDELYDELIRVLTENIPSKFILSFYECLDQRVSRLDVFLSRYRKLLEKLKNSSTIKKQLEKRDK